MLKRAIEVAVDLLHIGALTGCGHMLGDGLIAEALLIALCGGLCIVILTGTAILADRLWEKYRGK